MGSARYGCLRPPPEDTPDREVYDTFAQWLRETEARGKRAVVFDPAWQGWIHGDPEWTAPATWHGPAVLG